jgi:hypothetical protein
MTEHKGLPVSGYRQQSQENVDRVNNFKRLEEQVLRELDKIRGKDGIDQRWLAIGTTNLEQAFMAINRSVFRPERVKLGDQE